MRKRYTNFVVILVGLVLSLLSPQPVAADTGPKPTMDFTFTQDFSGLPLTITGGTQFECEQADCSDAQPFKKLGPQRFWCDADVCRSIGYVYSPYHRLEIQFSDGKTRQSNIFPTAGFNATYKVTIRPDDLVVEAEANQGAAPVEPTPSRDISPVEASSNQDVSPAEATPNRDVSPAETASKPDASSPLPYALIGVGGVCLALIVAFAFILIWRRSSKRP